MALRLPACLTRARRPSRGCAGPRSVPCLCAALRAPWTAAVCSLAAQVSRPLAGRDARSRARSAGNWPPVGDICIARPRPARPARPHPRGGTLPATAPPPLHLSAGWAQGSQAVGNPRQGRLLCALHPRPGIAGGAPAPPWLCLSVDTPRTSRLVFTRAFNSLVRRAGAQGSNQPALTCAPPSAFLLPTCCQPLAPLARTWDGPGLSAGGTAALGTVGTSGPSDRWLPPE